jgi:hypothetical protein
MPDTILRKEGNQLILHTDGIICSNAKEVASSDIFEDIVRRYIHSLQERESPLLDNIQNDLSEPSEVARFIAMLRLLVDKPIEEVVNKIPGINGYIEQRETLHQMVEGLYNFWRSFGRFMICHSSEGQENKCHHFYRRFNVTMENLTSLVRSLYRDICENISGQHPRVFRQVCAGCEVGLVTVRQELNCPQEYKELLEGIPFIRQVLLNPPLLFNPPMNKRTGQFRRVGENPLEGLTLDKSQWLCYPAQVGSLVIFIFFHQKFTGLGASLSNLFEIATDEQIAQKPDAVYVYGAPAEPMSVFGQLPTVFFDDIRNNLLVAAVPDEDRFGYFGYLKKMVLTLHNIVMMKNGRMPFHGAMVRIELKNGGAANVLLIGDTATGKSESLEAFRRLGKDNIRDLKIIADDMGSLEIAEDGKLIGYGTEIGAFIRLDDLEYGYAFGQIDRAIIMNPHLVNARVVLPVTTLEEIIRGYPVDILLYANNYDEVDEHHPIIEPLLSTDVALATFREGAALSKGTTTSTGLTHSYFANIFGAPQYRDLHEQLAVETFEAAFSSGTFLGQIRTRLGIGGYETSGPEEAARALFGLIAERNS